jgi:hypothetical protein
MTDPTSLDEDTIVAEARAKTGLDDFGDEAFRVPMRMLLASLDREAALTPVGRRVQRQRIVDLLANRLRVADEIRRHPEIHDERIEQPIVIVGLPRTGTTLLHRTIASDPSFHSVRWYECRYPARLGTDAGGPDPRLALAEAEVRAMLEGSPALAAIHPLEAAAPDEEILLLEHAFYSTVPESGARVPSYARWLEAQDQRDGYRYLKTLLQLLQWQKRRAGSDAQRWVLKTPHHLGFADLLLAEFPDAVVVQTHRDPVESIPSLASMICALWVLSSEHVDPPEVARHWSGKMARALHHCMEVRDLHPTRFADVWFLDAVQDTIGVVRRVFDFAGMALTPAAEHAMRAFLATNPREGRPPHQYTLAEFGLSAESLACDFATYRERFILGRH